MIPTPRVPTLALRFPISVFAHTVPSTWKALPTSQFSPPSQPILNVALFIGPSPIPSSTLMDVPQSLL